ncbi:putative glutamate carboxypeptidase 2 [Platanthera zijinensis]|uniref:Glutamate carboxypeptidase 2 n=1 Tax=Platanthera zijinensis TaxID=2320716 RepID=A0AAP0AZG0_9ASPA
MKGYEEPDRYVILGSHRDSWTYGVSSHLGALLCCRWSSKKTIILCSWDAEKFGIVRSQNILIEPAQSRFKTYSEFVL